MSKKQRKNKKLSFGEALIQFLGASLDLGAIIVHEHQLKKEIENNGKKTTIDEKGKRGEAEEIRSQQKENEEEGKKEGI